MAAGTVESHGRECSGDRSGLAMMLKLEDLHILTYLDYKFVLPNCIFSVRRKSRLRKGVGSLHGLFVGFSRSLSELP